MEKTKTEKFVERAREIHGDRYDYSLCEYIGSEKKLKIVCSVHGEFLQSPHGHLKGAGCFKCGVDRRIKGKERFVEEARKIHGNRYDYEEVEYQKNTIPVSIYCEKHGSFFQTPSTHLSGYGCQKCGNENDRKSQEEFLNEVSQIHGDLYDYSKAFYCNYVTPLEIICKIHGSFNQTPAVHLRGSGCPKCGYQKSANFKLKLHDDFVKRAKVVHENRYDYSQSVYEGMHKKIKIFCEFHGPFEQQASSHLSGHGCKKCGIILCSSAARKLTKDFVSEANEKYNNFYDYSRVEYKNCETSIWIGCKIHGYFLQTPYCHLKGSGCQKCSARKGEILISNFLLRKNIFHVHEHKFLGCFYKKPLKFDFYLPDQNICIEYDGEQHFRPIKYFGGENKFELTVKRDALKTEFCKNNNIKLIRIRYDENVEKILEEEFSNV